MGSTAEFKKSTLLDRTILVTRVFSVAPMACANADGIFLTIAVGEAGRMSYGVVFSSSTAGRLLNR